MILSVCNLVEGKKMWKREIMIKKRANYKDTFRLGYLVERKRKRNKKFLLWTLVHL